MKKKILIITPEVYPQLKVGGLGKMVAGVTRGLRSLGEGVVVISSHHNIYQPLWCNKTESEYRQLGRSASDYCWKNNWRPDWVWVHDWGGVWSAGEFLKVIKKPRIVWTIHSPVGDNYDYGYQQGYDQPEGEPIDWGDSFFDFGGLVKRGVSLSQKITTVSQAYASRLSRYELFGGEKIIGINNGIDKREWNSCGDKLVAFNLKNSWEDFKKQNKKALQKKFELPEKDIPVFCFVSRMVYQKGLDILLKVLPEFLAKNEIQFIFVGAGQKKYLRKIIQIKREFPFKVGAKLEADFDLPHQVFAGADFLVLPSISEPFGIVVAEARQYGVIPIVHLVDGLKDQVKDDKNGLGFWKYYRENLMEKLYQALKSWGSSWQKNQWEKVKTSESWEKVSGDWMKIFDEQY